MEDVRAILARTFSPGNEGSVKVSRPSDALPAKAATDEGLTTLMLGLGAVALLVGGVGVANTMVISVLERPQEIGLRRSLGATRNAIRLQFLTESLLLSALGGATGALLGAAATSSAWRIQPRRASGCTPRAPASRLNCGFGSAVRYIRAARSRNSTSDLLSALSASRGKLRAADGSRVTRPGVLRHTTSSQHDRVPLPPYKSAVLSLLPCSPAR